MTKLLLALAFLLALIALPWWASTLVATLYLAEGGSALLVVIGAILADEIFGAPVASLHGFAFLYASLMIVLAAVAWYCRQAIYE